MLAGSSLTQACVAVLSISLAVIARSNGPANTGEARAHARQPAIAAAQRDREDDASVCSVAEAVVEETAEKAAENKKDRKPLFKKKEKKDGASAEAPSEKKKKTSLKWQQILGQMLF